MHLIIGEEMHGTCQTRVYTQWRAHIQIRRRSPPPTHNRAKDIVLPAYGAAPVFFPEPIPDSLTATHTSNTTKTTPSTTPPTTTTIRATAPTTTTASTTTTTPPPNATVNQPIAGSTSNTTTATRTTSLTNAVRSTALKETQSARKRLAMPKKARPLSIVAKRYRHTIHN
jgi:hypothetical protein